MLLDTTTARFENYWFLQLWLAFLHNGKFFLSSQFGSGTEELSVPQKSQSQKLLCFQFHSASHKFCCRSRWKSPKIKEKITATFWGRDLNCNVSALSTSQRFRDAKQRSTYLSWNMMMGTTTVAMQNANYVSNRFSCISYFQTQQLRKNKVGEVDLSWLSDFLLCPPTWLSATIFSDTRAAGVFNDLCTNFTWVFLEDHHMILSVSLGRCIA